MKQEINNYIYCLEIYSNNDEVKKLKGGNRVAVTNCALLSFCQVLHLI